VNWKISLDFCFKMVNVIQKASSELFGLVDLRKKVAKLAY